MIKDDKIQKLNEKHTTEGLIKRAFMDAINRLAPIVSGTRAPIV